MAFANQLFLHIFGPNVYWFSRFILQRTAPKHVRHSQCLQTPLHFKSQEILFRGKKERLPFLLFLLGLLCIKFHCVISIQKCQERKEIVSLSLFFLPPFPSLFSQTCVSVACLCPPQQKREYQITKQALSSEQKRL